MLRSLFAQFKLPGGARRWVGLFSFLILLALVVGACGASNSASGTTAHAPSSSNSGSDQQPVATAGGTGSGSSSSGQPTLPNGTPANTYLIRTLSVTLVVNRPLDAESQVRQDVLAKDPLAQGAGEQISQQSDGSYTVSVTFAVSAAKYDDIKAYLNGFSSSYPSYKGKLASENETVQNVSTQYVDLQSRLKNLQTEQQRLLQLLSQAQNLTDTLAIQDKLTDVEGQIEQIEGQINLLNSQTAYSNVTINLSSNAPPTPPAPTPPKPWSPGDIFSTAASVMVTVLQILVDVLIWVGVFAIFWVPALVGFYFWRRVRRRPVTPKPDAAGVATP